MSSSAEDAASRAKLAKLVAALRRKLGLEFVEAILRTEAGDVNYAIPHSDRLKSIGMEPGTILHQVSDRRDAAKIVELLLRHGADVKRRNSRGQTAVLAKFAYRFDGDSENWVRGSFDSPSVEALLSAHVDHSIRENPSDDNGVTHFHVACACGHARAVEFFLDNGVDVDQAIKPTSPLFPGCSPLHMCVRGGLLETAKTLLERGASVRSKDADGSTPLRALLKRNLAIMNSKVDELLIEEYGRNQLMIRLLLTSSDASVDDHGFTDFHAACACDDLSIVEDMLAHLDNVDRSVDADSPLWPGCTPLHFAAHCNAGLVELLLARGANLLAEDANGLTPLEICSQIYPVADLLRIMSSRAEWTEMVLSDNSTRLVDVLRAMESEATYRSVIDRIEDFNCRVNEDSPLWPGHTLLHLAVLFCARPRAEVYRALRRDAREDVWPSLTMIEECIAKGADFTAQDTRGRTPLHLAFYSQKEDIARVFLDNGHGRATNPIDENNVSHLHIACACGAHEAARRLIANGADVNLPTSQRVKLGSMSPHTFVAAGSTPLHMAVTADDVDIATHLLQCNAELNASNDDGWTPLHCAMLLEGPERIGKALFAFSSKLREGVVEDVQLTHLHVACQAESLEGVEKLIELGTTDLNAAIKLDIDHAKYAGHRCEFNCQLLCERSFAGFTPLHFAVRNNSIEIATALLEAGADVLARNAKGMSPLFQVLEMMGSAEMFDLFVHHLCRSEDLQERLEETSGITLMHIFASSMDCEGVEQLIADGAEANGQVDADSPIWPGCTALHIWVEQARALGYGDANVQKMLKMLLSAGADITLANSVNETPLHAFSSRMIIDGFTTLSTGRLMLNSQKDYTINPMNANGVSHFHVAVRFCDVGTVKKFLIKGVEVNQQVDSFTLLRNRDIEKPGYTALHAAMHCKSQFFIGWPARQRIVDLLLNHGIDVNARDVLGNTPLHLVVASEYMRETLLEKFVRAGGKLDSMNVAGETPFAVLLKCTNVIPRDVKFFIEHGCRVNDFNIFTQSGILALHVNANFRWLTNANNVYRALFKSSDIKGTDNVIRRTAIHNIVSLPAGRQSQDTYRCYVKLIKRLVKLGCDVDAQDSLGRTALHAAARFRNKAALEALLIGGADINVVDGEHQTALDYALTECRCSWKEDPHLHSDVIETLMLQLRKLKLLDLHVTRRNEVLYENSRGSYSINMSLILWFQELRKAQNLKVVYPCNLHDFLQETGAIASYTAMPLEKRQEINRFFGRTNTELDGFVLLKSLFALQYNKIRKRSALIERARKCLLVVGPLQIPETCTRLVLMNLGLCDIQNLIFAAENF